MESSGLRIYRTSSSQAGVVAEVNCSDVCATATGRPGEQDGLTRQALRRAVHGLHEAERLTSIADGFDALVGLASYRTSFKQSYLVDPCTRQAAAELCLGPALLSIASNRRVPGALRKCIASARLGGALSSRRFSSLR